MNKWQILCLGFAGVIVVGVIAVAQGPGLVKPRIAMREVIQGMPKGNTQEVRVLNVNFEPRDRTPFHTHHFPVTVYVLDGTFTMEVEGRAPITVKAGEAKMMPPHVKMTGYNRSNTEPLRLVAFYVSDPDTPFLDPAH